MSGSSVRALQSSGQLPAISRVWQHKGSNWTVLWSDGPASVYKLDQNNQWEKMYELPFTHLAPGLRGVAGRSLPVMPDLLPAKIVVDNIVEYCVVHRLLYSRRAGKGGEWYRATAVIAPGNMTAHRAIIDAWDNQGEMFPREEPHV